MKISEQLATAGIVLVAVVLLSAALYVLHWGYSPSFRVDPSFSNEHTARQLGSLRTAPNFILIVADDLGWNSLGYSAQGLDEEIGFATPALSNLAAKGLIMDQFYAQEVCSPARASLLTGRYPLSVGMQYGMVAVNAEWGLDLRETLLPEVLRDRGGYATHALGKWHLGYHKPEYLPTARGFDTFIGYLNGESYYWSKHNTDYPDQYDLMESDTQCYAPYLRSDRTTYSTFLYRDRAVDIINSHNTSIPLFMYVAFQAVHDPYNDLEDDANFADYLTGIPTDYLDTSTVTQIKNKINGEQRKQYVSALNLLDTAVGDISSALIDRGMAENTYIIFMSDNGGCHESGGRNGPLRGSKGSLFEGGVKVNSFVYAPGLLHSSGKYYNLMHISDWFPTILSLAGIHYNPTDDDNSEGFALDGVDHQSALLSQAGAISSNTAPRTDMLYNMYVDLVDYDFNIWTNGSFAVRDQRFKLMHTFDDADYGAWHMPTLTETGDDDIGTGNRCAQQFLKGEFKYWLFDLKEDPFEFNNLYYSTYFAHVHAKKKLYSLLDGYRAKARTKISIVWDETVEDTWAQFNNSILPFSNVTDDDAGDSGSTAPQYCEGFSLNSE